MLQGVVFPKKQANDLVLLSLPNSYGQFVENFHLRNIDVTLTYPTYMLIVVEAEMIKSLNEVEMFIGSNPKIFLDIGNGNIGYQEKISLPN